MRRLLVVDLQGHVALTDLDTGDTVAVNQKPAEPAVATPARTAVWSHAGQWVAAAFDSDDVDGTNAVIVYHVEQGTTRLIASALTAFYLCPSPCGRYLSHLSPGPLGLELVVSGIDTDELHVVERGQPMFWSWSPDASQLAVHVGRRVVLLSRDGANARVVSDEAGSFITPWWMSDGSVVLGSEEAIISHAPDGSIAKLAHHGGACRFAVDPDGRRLAMVDVVGDVPCLVVLDLLTGEREVIVAERTAAFFWSPEGRRLAALVLAGRNQLQWIVSDGDGVVRLAPFRPAAGWVREVLPFFEQYAQSHAVWSPDGRQLVATGVDADGSAQAIVQTADATAATETLPGARLAWWAAQ